MKYLQLPNEENRLLPFYLAMEEFATRFAADDEIFFMWQVDPTVIFGRNQLIYKEVNLDYCKENNIQTYRRKSGGGCVYADRDNIMFSYVTKSDNVTTTFNAYTERIAKMLQGLGLNATSGGRNDVLIDGLKVSGNAFYHVPGFSIVHGTMLYDTNMTHMLKSITPSNVKLESKGVESVRKHITTLHEHIDLTIEQFKEYVKDHLCDGEILLSEHDIEAIKKIEEPYYSEAFVFGKNPKCNISKHKRIDGVGEFEVTIELNHNQIIDLNIAGDYFLLGDIDSAVIEKLKGVNYSTEAISSALSQTNIPDIIMNLDNDRLIDLLTT